MRSSRILRRRRRLEKNKNKKKVVEGEVLDRLFYF
jgi:hypothetical protein